MIVPEFLRFYQGYTRESVLKEYAQSFFSLVNAMYRLKASELIDNINAVAAGMSDGSDRAKVIKDLGKQSKGIHGLLQEVRVVSQVRQDG